MKNKTWRWHLRSVLAQQDVELEVIVVNDHSSDRTGPIADSFAAADGRVKVIHDPELPPGWLGKCNAMQKAAAVAAGDVLLFTDADIVHAPRLLRHGSRRDGSGVISISSACFR